MAEGDLAEALRRLMERGWRTSDPTRRDLAGLADLRERLRRRREELQERYQLRDVLADVRQELDDIVAEERAGIERRLDEAADPAGRLPERPGAPEDAPRRRRPPDRPARRASAGRRRPDPEARGVRLHGAGGARPVQRADRAAPEADARPLRRRPVGGDPGTTPEDLAANRDMVRDLNELLEQRLEGASRPGPGRRLPVRHGRFFPGARTLDDIVEQLDRADGGDASLLRSMTPQQRAELESMMDALLRDDRLRWDLAQLASNMDQLMPDGLGEGYEFSGDEPLGLEPALERIGQLQALDRLEDQLGMVESPGDLADLDRDEVRDLLGPDSARDLEALDELARQLEEAGYLCARAIGWS